MLQSMIPSRYLFVEVVEPVVSHRAEKAAVQVDLVRRVLALASCSVLVKLLRQRDREVHGACEMARQAR